MSESQLLAIVAAILLQGQSLSSDDQVRRALLFAKVIVKEAGK